MTRTGSFMRILDATMPVAGQRPAGAK